MMKINAISSQPDRAGRYKIYFENDVTMRLYRQTVEDFCLYVGLDLDDATYKRLEVASGEMSAKMRAVRIVSATNISKKDLEHRLVQKGEDVTNARKAVEWMSDLNILDDRRTAEQIVMRCISKGYGINRAKQALYEKRIPKSLWDEALEDYPDQTDTIVSFLRSRLHEPWDKKDLKRAIDALIRRGYHYGEIRRGLKLLSLEDEFLEE